MVAERIGFVSTFPPRQCGIATFTSDLVRNVSQAGATRCAPLVVALSDTKRLSYPQIVRQSIRQNHVDDYLRAADYLNRADLDVVSLQHEYGIFGGATQAGEYVQYMLDRIEVPVVTTFHTVLLSPSVEQYWATRNIAKRSARVVVMSQRGAEMLRQVYNIAANKIVVIPHGIPDLPLTATSEAKRRYGLAGRTVILTFGLLGRNKGIDVMLQAMTRIVSRIPDAIYIVLGATHPNVLKVEGEAYRRTLERSVAALGLEKHVVFQNEFVDDSKLYEYLRLADFYVTPYLSERQIVSGTLAFALGSGRAIVSTPYWYAQELLADGHGRLVPFRDPEAIAQAITGLMDAPEECQRMQRRAYLKGRTMTWPTVGKAYRQLFTAVARGAPIPSCQISNVQPAGRGRPTTVGAASRGKPVAQIGHGVATEDSLLRLESERSELGTR